MPDERLENLIQRCVDGELTSAERRELLADLEHHPDGWKTVACSFMEDQLFSGAATDLGGTRPTMGGPQTVSPQPRRHWFSHPVTSLVLSLCVAFLGGLLVSDAWIQSGGTAADVAQSNGSATSPEGQESSTTPVAGDSRATAALVAGQPNYSVRFEADGLSSRELPVYDDESAFLNVFREHQMAREAAAPTNGTDSDESELHFLRLELNGRTILVPYKGRLPDFQ